MHPSLLSPDIETYSTPPTSPRTSNTHIRPSLSRRTSRPSSIHTEFSKGDWTSAVVLERLSPDVRTAIGNGHVSSPATAKFPSSPLPSIVEPSQCPHMNGSHFRFSPTNSTPCSEDEEDHGGSLTEQLAETAVGVREMSKQLGRARARSNIQNVLIITKARDNRLIKLTRELALYLMIKHRNGQARGLVVYVDDQLRNSRRFDAEGIKHDHPELFVPYPRRRSSSSNSLSSLSSLSAVHGDSQSQDEGQLRYWTSDMCSHSPHLFDFVITLGGDGTVLFTSWLFQRIVPPVLPFSLGSLGFLTNFDFADHQTVMDTVIDSGIRVNLRMRFTCTVYRAVPCETGKRRKAVKKGETGEIMMKNVEKGGWEALEGGWSGAHSNVVPEGGKCRDKEIMCFTTRPAESFEVLNDLVVDRGPSPYVSLLELFGDEHHMTTVQADGLTVSTPTGSTAYSLSAGGSLVHPQIPALLITPICPHTLSFRPMLLPDSMELRICVPFNSRSTAWASFDGRGRVELRQGDHIKVTASKYPFPTVCADKQSTDWFHSISRTLKWNERERQKSFVVVEEGPAKPQTKRSRMTYHPDQHVTVTDPEAAEGTLEDEDEDEVSDEDEDNFDIKDSSPEAAASKLNADRLLRTNEKAPGIDKANEGGQGHVSKRLSKSKSPSRSRVRSGVDTPGRYAGPQAHPPRTVMQHLIDTAALANLMSNGEGRQDTRTGKSKMLADLELMKTPTMEDVGHGRRHGHHGRSSSSEHHAHRAFAAWGQDESDSNTSDSDV